MRTFLGKLDLKGKNVAYWVMTSGRYGETGNLESAFEKELTRRGARIVARSGLCSERSTETDKAAFARQFAQKLIRTLKDK